MNQPGKQPNEAVGLIHVLSLYSVTEAADRLETLLKAKNLIVFLRLDQQAEAAKVGLVMRPTQLILFGNPKAGTVLMNDVPSVAIDLPLKVLIWEDGDHQTWFTYNDPAYLRTRHGLTDEQVALISGVAGLINAVVHPNP